jgi:UDP-N-acetylglucosamine acyltransferase
VLPFSNTVTEREAKVFGSNSIGLKRRGFKPETVDAIHKAFRLLTHSGLNTTQALERIAAEIQPMPEIDELTAFIKSAERGFIK